MATTTLTQYSTAIAFTPVTVSGGTCAFLNFAVSPALPAGLSLSASTGRITGTPTTTLAATNFTVTVTEGLGQSTGFWGGQQFSLTVNQGVAALSTTVAVASTTLTQNSAATAFIPVTASGGTGTLSYALSGGTLPTGLTFDTTSGQITGTPTTTLAATSFTVTVTDQSTPTAQTSSKTFSLAVTAPALTTTQAVATNSVTAGSPITPYTPVTASGGFGTLSYSVSPSLPTGLTFDTTSGQITGTPTTTLAATNFTVTVTDQSTPTAQTSSKTFSLAVTAPALTTTQAVATNSVTAGSPITAYTPVTASGGFGTLSDSVSPSLPTGLSFSTGTGQVTGAPTTLLSATSFTVTATDQTTPTAQTSSKTFSLAVTPPVLTTTQAVPTSSVVAGALLTPFTPVTASGGFGTITFALTGTLPTGLAFNAATGQITGTPTVALATTSFTVTASDSATPTPQTSSKTFSLTVNKITTTTSLTVSTPSGMIGQSFTLTATAAPSSATGTVTFSDGGIALCANVPVTGGVATCTAKFASGGTHSITATYSGSATQSSSTSAAIAIAITDQTGKTVAAIGQFMGARNNQILTNGPDAGRQIDRLIEAGGGTADGADGGVGVTGFAASRGGSATAASGLGLASSRLGDGPDATDVSRLRGFAATGARPIGDAIAANAAGANVRAPGNPGAPGFGNCGTGFGSGSGGFTGANQGGPGTSIAARFGQTGSSLAGFSDPCASGSGNGGGYIAMGGMRFTGTLDGAMQLGFATSLRDMTRAATEANAKKAADAGMGLSARPGTAGAARPNPFDIWVEGKYGSFSDSRSQADLTGHFGLFSIGADYVLNPSLLFGTMVQFDSMQQRSDSKATDVRGAGWMAGPYATLRLSQNLFWQVRGAWGQSSNTVSPFLTYADSFDSTRWLVSSTLTGRWTSGAWSFRPTASISYMEDVSKSYADTFGVIIPSVKSTLGQAKAGPEIGYRFDLGHTVIEPRAGVQVIYNFANDTSATGFSQIGGDTTGPAGVRGRAEIGVGATTSGGIGLDRSGSYDGIGAAGYNAVTGKATLRLPLN